MFKQQICFEYGEMAALTRGQTYTRNLFVIINYFVSISGIFQALWLALSFNRYRLNHQLFEATLKQQEKALKSCLQSDCYLSYHSIILVKTASFLALQQYDPSIFGNVFIFSFVGHGIIKVAPHIVWEAVRNPLSRFIYDSLLKVCN